MSKLSDRQKEVLAYLDLYLKEHDRFPTLRELGQHFRFTSPVALRYMRVLERKGYLSARRDRQARLIRRPGPPGMEIVTPVLTLTSRQREVLAQLAYLQAGPASIRPVSALAEHFKMGIPAISVHLHALASKGCVKWRSKGRRNVEVTELGRACLVDNAEPALATTVRPRKRRPMREPQQLSA